MKANWKIVLIEVFKFVIAILAGAGGGAGMAAL